MNLRGTYIQFNTGRLFHGYKGGLRLQPAAPGHSNLICGSSLQAWWVTNASSLPAIQLMMHLALYKQLWIKGSIGCAPTYIWHPGWQGVTPWVTGSTSSVDVLGHKRVLYKKKETWNFEHNPAFPNWLVNSPTCKHHTGLPVVLHRTSGDIAVNIHHTWLYTPSHVQLTPRKNILKFFHQEKKIQKNFYNPSEVLPEVNLCKPTINIAMFDMFNTN